MRAYTDPYACRVSAIAQRGSYPNARDFYDYLLNRIVVRFYPKGASKTTDEDSFDLALSKKMSYDQFSAKVGERLNVDPTHVRFSTVNATNLKAKSVVRRNLNQTLYQTLNPQFNTYNANQKNDMLYYEVMDMSLSEMETKKGMKLTWVSEGLSKEVCRMASNNCENSNFYLSRKPMIYL